jgi:hypothetical protein
MNLLKKNQPVNFLLTIAKKVKHFCTLHTCDQKVPHHKLAKTLHKKYTVITSLPLSHVAREYLQTNIITLCYVIFPQKIIPILNHFGMGEGS